MMVNLQFLSIIFGEIDSCLMSNQHLLICYVVTTRLDFPFCALSYLFTINRRLGIPPFLISD